jgi:glycosyltransferase involved in cell wall biosynthesis
LKILLHDYGGYPFSLQLGISLAEAGHRVHYVYSQSTQQVQRITPRRGDALFSCEGIRLNQPFEKYHYLKRRYAEIEHGKRAASRVTSFQPDVVISANSPLDAQASLQDASRKMGARFMYWFQDAIGLAMSQALGEKVHLIGHFIGFYYRWKEKCLLQRSQQVILISEAFMPLMRAYDVPEEKIHVVPNWAPVDEITPEAHHNPWAVQMGLTDTFNFLYTGVLGLKHDPSIFLRMAEHFKTETDIRIVVVSGGDHLAWLRSEKEMRGLDNLVLLDFQPAEVYPQILASGDVLMGILNSDAGDYAVPSKVMSYLCAQRPILLSSPVGNAAAQIVTRAGAGLVSAPDDLAGLMNHAENLCRHGHLRDEMGRSGREYAIRHFAIHNICQVFEEIISRCG